MPGRGPRVILLTRDGRYSRLFYQHFISKFSGEVVGVGLSAAYLHRGVSPLVDLARYVARVGPAYAIYQAWVSCPAPMLCGGLPSIRRMATQQGIPVYKTNDINDQASESWFGSLDADFMLSFHFNQRIGNHVISMANTAALNFHPSVLPAYRGVDPVLFGLADGHDGVGCSIHLLSEKLDQGDVLLQSAYPRNSRGLVNNNSMLFSRGGELAARVINEFERYYPARFVQQEVEGNYYGWERIKRISLWSKRWK